MGNTRKCSIIICDDFSNVLIAQKGKGKKNSSNVWCIFGKDVKGKETDEKCITKAVDKDLKCNIFELTPFKEYADTEESGDTLLVYTGRIREQVTCHKDINKIKWISEREMDMYDFSINEKEMLSDFFKSIK